MSTLMKLRRRATIASAEQGQTVLEYSLVLGVITVVMVGVLKAFGSEVISSAASAAQALLS